MIIIQKHLEFFWQYSKDEWALDANDVVTDFNKANATKLFNLKAKITGQTDKNGTKHGKIMVPLLIVKLILITNWSKLATAITDQGARFSITDTNFMFQL